MPLVTCSDCFLPVITNLVYVVITQQQHGAHTSRVIFSLNHPSPRLSQTIIMSCILTVKSKITSPKLDPSSETTKSSKRKRRSKTLMWKLSKTICAWCTQRLRRGPVYPFSVGSSKRKLRGICKFSFAVALERQSKNGVKRERGIRPSAWILQIPALNMKPNPASFFN